MNIHLIAICGSGMGQLAQMLKMSGHHVTGSDVNVYPPMSTLLTEAGIVCHPRFDPHHIQPDTDLVVIGNAVSSANVEVQEVLRRKIAHLSFPQALAHFFLKERSPVVITGTHGKTTTAALMAWVLESAGKDPGLLIGGWAKNFQGGAKIGSGPFFVVEGDEYDTAFFDKEPKFLHYQPQWAILTSIEFDHADIYKNLEHLKSAFQKFVGLLPSKGLLLAAQGDPHVGDVIEGARCSVALYGIENESSALGAAPGNREDGWIAKELCPRSGGVSFDVAHQGAILGRVESPLFGYHNVRNVLAVIAMANHLGLSMDAIAKGVSTFEGVKRRQEVFGVVDGITMIDDFAHHPTAIYETLVGIRQGYPGGRVWAVFEPRSATSRRNIFQNAFVRAFSEADEVILADLYAPEKIQPQDRLDPTKLVEDLRHLGKSARFIPTADEIVLHLRSHLRPRDIVCIMSSGGFGDIHSKLLAALQSARSASSTSERI
jgi:UDP-N-acetylmuramate: L-alanyl-gamma-D-glutamyl-meso-diaminopimelate ligase